MASVLTEHLKQAGYTLDLIRKRAGARSITLVSSAGKVTLEVSNGAGLKTSKTWSELELDMAGADIVSAWAYQTAETFRTQSVNRKGADL